jgi:hypothetical protein
VVLEEQKKYGLGFLNCYNKPMNRAALAVIFILFAQAISYAQPVARFVEMDKDLGVVSDMDKVEHAFELSNTGDRDLVIEKVVATSGNTKARASSRLLKPGEKGSITAIIDMRGRKGIFFKKIEVYTNDPITPVTTLSVKVTAKDRIHMAQYKATAIFSEECKGCHVERGRGKKGWELFKADCFMCHNAGKNTSLSTMSRKPAKDMLKAIREGVENTLMPGFDISYGGPLDDNDIKSLMDLIKP